VEWDNWKSGDEDEVVDGEGVGVGGGAIGPDDQVCTSKGLRNNELSVLGKEPYARNMML
jgi:hypothetical protein